MSFQANFCQECGTVLAVADPAMVRNSAKDVGVKTGRWAHRHEEENFSVCPRCDAYALGVDMTTRVPFYVATVRAFMAVDDWDWWNDGFPTVEMDAWPFVGKLRFSESSIRGAVAFVQSGVGSNRRRLAAYEAARDGASSSAIDEALGPFSEMLHDRYLYAELKEAIWLLLEVAKREQESLALSAARAKSSS